MTRAAVAAGGRGAGRVCCAAMSRLSSSLFASRAFVVVVVVALTARCDCGGDRACASTADCADDEVCVLADDGGTCRVGAKNVVAEGEGEGNEGEGEGN